ncbi:MAG: hypothetical protein KDA66_01480, partial [Planctomycetaceae bacterium]|nr:hypothetical protein [Planctomycetaceae bacterium]
MSPTPDEFAAELPEPQQGEPENLRQDILDELADHLQCALNDEQRRSACEGRLETEEAEQVARGRVIERFGNPVQIACRLWWDAMWEKVMSQRVQTISVVVGVLVVVGMFFLMWGELRNSRAQLNAQLDESRDMQKQLMDELTRVRQQPQAAVAAQPAEWNNLSVLCVTAGEQELPLEGVKVSFRPSSEHTTGIPPAEEVTDATGRIDFGQVLYGQYTFTFTTSNGFIKIMNVSVRPGQDELVKIVCPTGDGEVPLKLMAPQRMPGLLAPSPETREHIQRALSLNPEIPIEKQIWTVYCISSDDPYKSYVDWRCPGVVVRYVAANEAGDIVPLTELNVRRRSEKEDVAQFHHGIGRLAYGRVSLPEIQQAMELGEFDANVSWPLSVYQCNMQFIAIPTASSDSSEFWLLESGQIELIYSQKKNGPYGGAGYSGSGASFDGAEGYVDSYGDGDADRISRSASIGHLSEQLLRNLMTLEKPETPPVNDIAKPGTGSSTVAGYPGGSNVRTGGFVGFPASYWVTLESPAEITLPDSGFLFKNVFVAALINRLPSSMTIGEIAASTDTPILNREGLGYDLIWKGVTVNDSGDVTPEEHVLLKNIDVFGTLNDKQLAVAMSPREWTVFSFFCRAGEVSVRPTGTPARQQPIDGTDGEDVGPLMDRLRQTRPLMLPGERIDIHVNGGSRPEQLTVSHDPDWTPTGGTAVDLYLRLNDGTSIPCLRKTYIKAIPDKDEMRSSDEGSVTGTYTLYVTLSHPELMGLPESLGNLAHFWLAPTTDRSGKTQVSLPILRDSVNRLKKL